MTARELLLAGPPVHRSPARATATDGRIRTTDGSPLPGTLDEALHRYGAVQRRGAARRRHRGRSDRGRTGGAGREGRHRRYRSAPGNGPGVLEIPFDSDYKFMATFHRLDRRAGTRRRAVLRQGRPGRAGRASRPLPRRVRSRSRSTMPPRRATSGRTRRWPSRACGCWPSASRTSPPPTSTRPTTRRSLLDRLVLVALVGIVDPPRPEARRPSRQCRDAGIRVRMITGDHAVTAAAIAGELGIPGRAVTGADLDAIADDAELARRARRHRRGRPGVPGAQDPDRARRCRTAARWWR